MYSGLLELFTRKFLEMGEEPKLTCAGDSWVKTNPFSVVLGALNLKEPSPLWKVFGHLCIRDSCPLTVIQMASAFCTGSPDCCTEVW